MFGLKQRSVRGPNKKKKVAEQVSKSEKPVFSKPSMPIIPKSKFFDTPVGKDADHFITY